MQRMMPSTAVVLLFLSIVWNISALITMVVHLSNDGWPRALDAVLPIAFVLGSTAGIIAAVFEIRHHWRRGWTR